MAWAAALGATVALGGIRALAGVLALAYAVQTAPSIWSAYRTKAPTGVSATTWLLVSVEAGLWGVYGLAHDDPATTSFAIIGSIAAAAILLRKVVTRHPPSVVLTLP